MKKILIIAILLNSLFFLASCKTIGQKGSLGSNNKMNYLGGDYKGNYVWGGAMNLAWNELNQNILHEPLRLSTNDKIALGMVGKLNNATFSNKDLDKSSYYVKSGYGQQTVETINKESRDKFPEKSFGDLMISLKPTDIIAYAYFLKKVEYMNAFKEITVKFNNEDVKGFFAYNGPQRKNVKILRYSNDDHFIVSIRLKDSSDELIMAKGYGMADPRGLVDEINMSSVSPVGDMDNGDRFAAPKLHLDHERSYSELMDKFLANAGFAEYSIEQMYEKIKFDMDEKGARVENEAVIIGLENSPMVKQKVYKRLIFDKPYWVMMKRKNSKIPFFILGVSNTELMEKAE